MHPVNKKITQISQKSKGHHTDFENWVIPLPRRCLEENCGSFFQALKFFVSRIVGSSLIAQARSRTEPLVRGCRVSSKAFLCHEYRGKNKVLPCQCFSVLSNQNVSFKIFCPIFQETWRLGLRWILPLISCQSRDQEPATRA